LFAPTPLKGVLSLFTFLPSVPPRSPRSRPKPYAKQPGVLTRVLSFFPSLPFPKTGLAPFHFSVSFHFMSLALRTCAFISFSLADCLFDGWLRVSRLIVEAYMSPEAFEPLSVSNRQPVFSLVEAPSNLRFAGIFLPPPDRSSRSFPFWVSDSRFAMYKTTPRLSDSQLYRCFSYFFVSPCV